MTNWKTFLLISALSVASLGYGQTTSATPAQPETDLATKQDVRGVARDVRGVKSALRISNEEAGRRADVEQAAIEATAAEVQKTEAELRATRMKLEAQAAENAVAFQKTLREAEAGVVLVFILLCGLAVFRRSKRPALSAEPQENNNVIPITQAQAEQPVPLRLRINPNINELRNAATGKKMQEFQKKLSRFDEVFDCIYQVRDGLEEIHVVKYGKTVPWSDLDGTIAKYKRLEEKQAVASLEAAAN